MDIERRTVEFEGCGLSWFACGPADAPVILFIHGTGVGGRAWEPQVDALASEFRCVCLDNRGFGGSQPAPRSVTIEQMARDSLAVLDASGAATAHVVGHSLGGLVALQVALLARRRCLSLSLLNTFADGGIPTGLSLRMLWFGTRTMVGTLAMRRRAFLEMVVAPEERAGRDLAQLTAQMSALFEHDLGQTPPISFVQLNAMRKANLTPRLGELAGLPTLILSSAHDPIAPPYAGRAMAAGITGARFEVFADSSHAAPILQPGRVHALLRAHLAQAR